MSPTEFMGILSTYRVVAAGHPGETYDHHWEAYGVANTLVRSGQDAEIQIKGRDSKWTTLHTLKGDIDNG